MRRSGLYFPAMKLRTLLLAFASTAAVAASVDFAPGLVTTSVIHDELDYEGIVTVTAVSASQSSKVIHWVRDDESAPGKKHEQSTTFTTRAEDLESARRVILVWVPGDPEIMPGSTSGAVSRLVLRELKQKGETAIVLGAAHAAPGGGLLGGLLTGRKYYRGTLKRVEPGPVAVSILLDGQRTTLPAIHARGRVTVGDDAGDAELWILDDEKYPMTLRWNVLGSSSTLVRIDNPQQRDPHAAAGGGGIQLGQALAGGACRAEMHGVYFNMGSAQLLPESGPAIEKIAALLKAQPSWTIAIEGHTDNIGAADYNLNLSRARAAAVRDTLIAQHGISAPRLTSAGYGATRPVESNATVEGRARNRRVELSRNCK